MTTKTYIPSIANPFPTLLSVSWNTCCITAVYISTRAMPASPVKIILEKKKVSEKGLAGEGGIPCGKKKKKKRFAYGRRPHWSVRYFVVMQLERKATVPYTAANMRIVLGPMPSDLYKIAIYQGLLANNQLPDQGGVRITLIVLAMARVSNRTHSIRR